MILQTNQGMTWVQEPSEGSDGYFCHYCYGGNEGITDFCDTEDEAAKAAILECMTLLNEDLERMLDALKDL